MNGELVTTKETESMFMDERGFEFAQRAAKLLAASSIIPSDFQNNVSNCTIALSMAQEMGVHPLTFMQGCYIVHGKPGIESKLAIGLLNTSGKTQGNIRFEYSENDTVCRALVKDLNGEEHEGEASIKMAKAEGWYDKNGSKWKTMPKQMLKYRSAMFLIRGSFPEVVLGMHSADELEDMAPAKAPSGEVDHVANLKAKQIEQEPIHDEWDARLTEAKAALSKCRTVKDVMEVVANYDCEQITMELNAAANEAKSRIKSEAKL